MCHPLLHGHDKSAMFCSWGLNIRNVTAKAAEGERLSMVLHRLFNRTQRPHSSIEHSQARSMPMPNAIVAATTGMRPADQSSSTLVRSRSLSPAWYAAALIPAQWSAPYSVAEHDKGAHMTLYSGSPGMRDVCCKIQK